MWDGGEIAGREGCWGGGRRVWRCWLVCVCVFVNECVYVSREGRGQGEERGMQEVYRWARDRAAKGVSFQILGTRTWVC